MQIEFWRTTRFPGHRAHPWQLTLEARSSWHGSTNVPLIELFHPNISDGDFARGAFNLDPNKPRLIIHIVRVIVDQHGHQLPVDYMQERAAPRDNLILVPVVRL